MSRSAYTGKEIVHEKFGRIRILPSLACYWYDEHGSMRKCPTLLKDTVLWIELTEKEIAVRCKGIDPKGAVIFDILPLKEGETKNEMA